MPAVPAPRSLGKDGRALWKKITGAEFTFRPDELDTLEDVCLIEDTIRDLTRRWVEKGSPMISTGSMGQEVIYPIVGELRQQRLAKNILWRQLKIPDTDAARPAGEVGPDGRTTSEKARAASMARWDRERASRGA